MADIYSTGLLAVAGVTTPVFFTCPAGYRTVLRCLDLYSGGTTTGFATYFEGDAGQTIYAKQWTAAFANWAGWRGRQVLDPGQACLVRSDQPVDVTLMGYLLAAP